MNTLSGKKRIQLAMLLGSLGLLGPFTIDTYLPSFPTIVKDFHTTASLVQISLTACLLGLGAGQLFIGPLSDVKGRRKPLLLFLCLYLLASLTCSFSPNIYFLIVARFVQGFSAAGGLVVSRAIVRDLFSGKELTKFFTLIVLVGNLGPIVAPIAGGAILSFTKWNGVFIVLACIGAILIFMVSLKLPETLPPEKRVPSNLPQLMSNFGSLFKEREFMGYAFTQGFTTAGIFAYVSGIPFVYQNIYHVSPQQFSLLFGVNGLGLIIGSQLVGRLADHISERTFLKIGLGISIAAGAILLIALLLKAPLIAVAIPIFFFVSSISIIGTTSFALAIESQGHIAGSASALLGLLPFVLGSLSAPLVGIAGSYTGVPMGVTIFGASLLAFLSYFVLVRKRSVKMQRPNDAEQGSKL
ncbi:Bcr/CflA family multidrug efflux MFS transporter [Priestia megaterium]|uniref:Bcr/CflA family multidrug efflux MFS transporter n=1 Tax=Priestia TaxID=2800373 RepID=UPI001C237C4D|nr:MULTISPECIES: Bcr/CflA family multidrug efflux MFS transporter [Priestia]MBU8753915.1 Bcr/CflA family multidrug efflux MFS transporter [Priestia megaterium]MCR8928904.1 Bcr/CflA family multidrug efflux MFS transporter [Priestia megaterium]MCU7712412.1 Bcr/CflA family multidrug efflux MFS transporter [Priestia megaterium]MCW1045147.1 Bcr/CflA family multidrug efflux MFS transporter [Priestia sp. JV24]MDQ0804204.1 DHA1 family bicyclomycin/chloramphenicol resistance-like MFS transporter [Pries